MTRDRRRERGMTLIEVLVSSVILSIALIYIVAAFSSATIGAAVAKRGTGFAMVTSAEKTRILGAAYSASATPYAACYATDEPGASPVPSPLVVATPTACGASYEFRADVVPTPQGSPGVYQWTIKVSVLPQPNVVNSPVVVYQGDQ
ncbi:MAG: PulJ/GspJ family protein [Candidatus Dormibacteria bacterium]